MLTQLTLDQLRANTKNQIQAAMDATLATWTKKQLIEFETGQVEFVRSTELTDRPDGQRDTIVTIYEDALGAKLCTVRISFVYFEDTHPAVIKKVVTRTLDANGVLIDKQVSRCQYPGDPHPLGEDDET